MEDRFKFRVFLKYNQIMCDIDSYCFLQGLNKCVFHLTNGGQKTLKNNDFILMQCTGLKDKNGKLIYEGDIVKYAEFDWTDFSFKDWETEIAQVVWGNTYDNYYPAFDLKYTDFDGTNAFAYLFNEGWTIEVIGNIYENPELLED